MLRSRLLKHVMFLSSGAAVSAIFGYLFRITCARTMPVEDYGRLALFLTIYVNLIIIAYFNMGVALTKYVSEYRVKDESSIPSFYASALTIAIFTSLTAFIVSMVIYARYDLLSLAIAVCLFFSFFLFAIHRINAGILQGFQKMGQVGALSATLSAFRFALLIAFMFLMHELTTESALLAYFLGIYLTSALSLFLALRLLRVKWAPWKTRLSGFKNRVHKSNMKQIASFSGYVVPRDLLSTALAALIPAFILSRTDFANVAYYDIALVIYSVAGLVMSALGTALLPEASRMEAKGTPLNYGSILRRLVLYSVILIAVAYILFYLGVDTLLIRLIFGEAFLPSASPLHILVFALPFQVYTAAASSFLLGMGNPRATLKIVILTFIISLPLYIVVLMVMQKGVSGAAMVFVVTQILLSIFSWRELRKNIYQREIACE